MDVPIEEYIFNKGQRDRITLSVGDADGIPVPLDPANVRLEVRKDDVEDIVPVISPADPNELLFVITPEWLRTLGNKPVDYRIRVPKAGDEEMFLTGTIATEGW